MKKIVIIDACCECPGYCGDFGRDYFYCDKIDREITNDETIPEWCPLQDAKEYVIKEK